MNKEVIVYTSNTCPHCVSAKDYLTQKGIVFTEKNVSIDREARQELISQGFTGVPIIKIGDDVVVGFKQDKLDELLAK
ncbi:MAG: glutaredoxin family protein [Firmicutes bacterium]|nr:glutaredoxin family protein [Bacillota bacterium]